VKDWKAFEIVVSRKEISAPRERIESPSDAVRLFKEFADESLQEAMFIVVVGGRNNMLGVQQLYAGTATGTSVAVGEMFRACIAMGGQGIVMVHNHPSGDSQPSDEDVKLTKDAVAASHLLDIQLLDHLVIGEGGSYTSIRSQKPSLWEQPSENLLSAVSEVIV
jgi:DNA repair protein RadC